MTTLTSGVSFCEVVSASAEAFLSAMHRQLARFPLPLRRDRCENIHAIRPDTRVHIHPPGVGVRDALAAFETLRRAQCAEPSRQFARGDLVRARFAAANAAAPENKFPYGGAVRTRQVDIPAEYFLRGQLLFAIL